MKSFSLFLALFSFASYAQIQKAADNLFDLANRDIRGKSIKQIEVENLENYDRFVLLDVNSRLYNPMAVIDAGKKTTLTKEQVNAVIQEAESNPVVALHQYNKYDKDNKGIGFCFGRAMFTHLFMTHAGVNRGNIKKAFVVGSMSGGSWGWHVTSIVQSKNAAGKEIWMATDPVVGYPIEVKAWYKHWLRESDDQKLKLYIAEAGKFGPTPSTYDERNKVNAFYNSYFKDMNEWFSSNDVRDSLR